MRIFINSLLTLSIDARPVPFGQDSGKAVETYGPARKLACQNRKQVLGCTNDVN
jgi:hypothetical protein